MIPDRGHLLTEQRNQDSAHIDRLSIEDGFDVFHAQDRTIVDAVLAAKPAICAAVRCVVAALESGGRLIYVGAGTSGRLGVIDAAECPPTFMTPPHLIQGIIAGGLEAMRRSVEGAEDRAAEAAAAVAERGVNSRDVVMGIAAGGTTPFVHAALDEAKRRGAKTIFLACVPAAEQTDQADISIRVLTGPEAITGSTRLKAGTATKMTLNMITSLSMVQLGKVYGNLMVDLNRDACEKLRDRAIRIIQQATGRDRRAAQELLAAAGDVKTAIVMHFLRVGATQAAQLLRDAGGRLRLVLDAGQRAE